MSVEGLLANGRIIEFALLLLTLEFLLLALRYRRTPSRLLPWIAGLGSGAALLLALRAVLTGADWRATGLLLLAALVGHVFDGWFRLRAEPT